MRLNTSPYPLVRGGHRNPNEADPCSSIRSAIEMLERDRAFLSLVW